jgi:hypothetical protein
LNKEIEYHDKIIQTLRKFYSQNPIEASDEAVIDGLVSGRKITGQFMLREELLEKIKKRKGRKNGIEKRTEKMRKIRESVTYRNVAVQCEDLIIEELDMEESLNEVIQNEKERNLIDQEYESEINKLGFELQTAKLRLEECKKVLSKKTDEISMIEMTNNNYTILNEDYKSILLSVRKKKKTNEELEEKLNELEGKYDQKKQGKEGADFRDHGTSCEDKAEN